MSFLRKILAKKRIRSAQADVSRAPSPRAYAALAQQYALAGCSREALATCEEGLAAFPANDFLVRLAERVRRMAREKRMGELRREVAEAPRPAVWREMCDILIESGMLARAEELAQEWRSATNDAEALVMLARVRCQRFLADRGREQGKLALHTLDEVAKRQPADARPWKLRLELLTRIGACREAKLCAMKLLELAPGDPELEGRYRTLESREEGSPTIERALIEVERTGRFADERSFEQPRKGSTPAGSVRPILRELAAEHDVHAAMYVRGATVLIQGPKGATAERTARSVRSVLESTRATARKLGLGQVEHLQVQGSFGVLSIAPGELDAGAIWSHGLLGQKREEILVGLAGLNADLGEVES